jgi:hypothetical protein
MNDSVYHQDAAILLEVLDSYKCMGTMHRAKLSV